MWKVTNYEVCGRSHKKNSIPCQDKTFYSTSNNVTIIALADGAGSAKLSHYGAETVIKAACEFFSNNFDALISNEDGKQVKIEILNYLLEHLKNKSEELSCNIKELASTFLLVAVKEDKCLISHIGDGLIGYLKSGELKIASQPENGEFANTTTFVTSKDAISAMKLFKANCNGIDGFVLMSDGTAESFYYKRNGTLATVLIKMLHWNAILDHNKMFENVKLSFDSVVVNNTQDDCSIVLMSRNSGTLYDYRYMNKTEKCDLLTIKYGSNNYKKQIDKFDNIIEFLNTPRTLKQVSRHFYIKEKYMRKSLYRLINIGLITKAENKFKKVNL